MTMTGESVSYCHFAHHISNIAWLGIEPDPLPFGFISMLRFVCLLLLCIVITDIVYGNGVI
jgi:hypothetical protein